LFSPLLKSKKNWKNVFKGRRKKWKLLQNALKHLLKSLSITALDVCME